MTDDPAIPVQVACPHCGKLVPWTDASTWRPFCSERCRMVDLGAWFMEDRGIPDAQTPPDAADDDASHDT